MRPCRFHPPLLAPRPDTELILLPHRAAVWPAARTLLVADLHWGKCETFRAQGAPLPQGILQADLQRLGSLLRTTESTRLVVLGDLLHASPGITEWLIEIVADWRAAHAHTEIAVIPGNHDRRIAAVAEAWALTIAPALVHEGPFAFVHDPDHAAAEIRSHMQDPRPELPYFLCGHLHPMTTLRMPGDRLRLPAFWMRPRLGILPAFSALTDGLGIAPAPGDQVFAAAPDEVIALR